MSGSLYNEDYKKIIKRLKEARLKIGLSQQDAADALGKPQSYISKIESGERRLDVVELKSLAGIYKQSVSTFIK